MFSDVDALPILAGGLVFAVVGGSAMTWSALVRTWLAGLPAIPRDDADRGRRPLWAVVAALAWTMISFADRTFADLAAERPEPKVEMVGFALVLSLTVLAVLATLLFVEGTFRLRQAGVWPRGWRSSVSLGGMAFLAAVLPTGLALVATSPLRSRETQHTLLRLVQEAPDIAVIAGLAFTAIVVAPLSEELLFRVTLQGWLTERTGPTVAIGVVAVLFAAIHGWRDGLALIPLSLILGYVHDRRNDYWAVVVAHGLFNAANLTLAILSTMPG